MSSNREIFNCYKLEYPIVVFTVYNAEIKAWLEEHIQDRFMITVTALQPEFRVAVTFKEKVDATLFKLTWC